MMDSTFACGLGFKCAEEAVLGNSSTFSKNDLCAFEDLTDSRICQNHHNSRKCSRKSLEDIHEYSNGEENNEDIIEEEKECDNIMNNKDFTGTTTYNVQDCKNRFSSIEPLREPSKHNVRWDCLPITLPSPLSIDENAQDSDRLRPSVSMPDIHPKVANVLASLRQTTRDDIGRKMLNAYNSISFDSAVTLANFIEYEIFSCCFELADENEPKEYADDDDISDDASKSSDLSVAFEPISLEYYSRCWRIIVDILMSSESLFKQISEGDLSAVRIIIQTALGQQDMSIDDSDIRNSVMSPSNNSNANDWDLVTSRCDISDSYIGIAC